MRSVTEHLKALQDHAPSLAQRGWRLAWSLLRHRQEAEDVVQDAFAVAARKPMQFPLDDPWPWFGTVIAGLARNARRKRARRMPQELPVYIPDHEPGPGQQAQSRELSRRLESEMERLPELEHEALALVHIGGLTFRQAADAMGVPAGTLPHYVRRGQDKLRRAFGKSDEACMALIAGAIPAMPDSLVPSVTASLSSAATSAAPKLLTGAVMIRLAILFVPLAMLGLLARWAMDTPQPTPVVSTFDPADHESYLPGQDKSPLDENRGNSAPNHAADPVSTDSPRTTNDDAGEPPAGGDNPGTHFGDSDKPGEDAGAEKPDKPVNPGDDVDDAATKPVSEPPSQLGSLAPWDAGAYIHDYAWTSDSKALVAGGDTRLVKFEARTGKRLWDIDVSKVPVESIAISPDGRILATSGAGSSATVNVCLWNAADGSSAGMLDGSGPRHILCVSPDGTQLVGVSDDEIHVWDLASRQLLRKFWFAPSTLMEDRGVMTWGQPEGISISADGASLLAYFERADCEGRICSWGLSDGTLRTNWRIDDADAEVDGYECPGRKLNLDAPLKLKDAWLNLDGCRFLPDGKHALCLVSGSDEAHPEYNAAFLLELATGKVSNVLKRGLEGVALSADGKLAASVEIAPGLESDDMTQLVLWSPSTGKVKHEWGDKFMTTARTFEGDTLTLSPDAKLACHAQSSRLYVTSTGDGKAMESGSKTKTAALDGHKDDVISTAFSPDGKLTVSSDSDGTVIVWDLAKGKAAWSVTKRERMPHRMMVSGALFQFQAEFSSDGKYVVAQSMGFEDDNTCFFGGADLDVWDSATGKHKRKICGDLGGTAVLAVACASGANVVVVATATKGLVVYDIDTGKQLYSVAHPAGAGKGLGCMALSADGMNAWLCCGRTLVHYDVAAGTSRILASELDLPVTVSGEARENDCSVSCLRLTPDGKRLWLAFSRDSGSLHELDAATGELLRRVCFHPELPMRPQMPVKGDGESKEDYRRRMDDYRAAIRDWSKQVTSVDKASQTQFTTFVIAPDGRRALACGAHTVDNVVYLLDVHECTVVSRLGGHTDAPQAVAISPDGARGLSAGNDKLLRFWELGTQGDDPVTGK